MQIRQHLGREYLGRTARALKEAWSFTEPVVGFRDLFGVLLGSGVLPVSALVTYLARQLVVPGWAWFAIPFAIPLLFQVALRVRERRESTLVRGSLGEPIAGEGYWIGRPVYRLVVSVLGWSLSVVAMAFLVDRLIQPYRKNAVAASIVIARLQGSSPGDQEIIAGRLRETFQKYPNLRLTYLNHPVAGDEARSEVDALLQRNDVVIRGYVGEGSVPRGKLVWLLVSKRASASMMSTANKEHRTELFFSPRSDFEFSDTLGASVSCAAESVIAGELLMAGRAGESASAYRAALDGVCPMSQESRIAMLRSLAVAYLRGGRVASVQETLSQIELLTGGPSCSELHMRTWLPPDEFLRGRPIDLAAIQAAAEVMNQRLDAAVAACKRELLTLPDKTATAFTLSSLSVRTADPNAALSLASEPYRASPNDGLILSNLAFAHSRLGQFSACQDYARRTTRIDPRDATARNNLGVCLAEDGQNLRAAGHLSLAILMDDGYADPRGARGISFANLRGAEVRRWIPFAWTVLSFLERRDIEAAVRLAPWDFVLRCLLANILVAEGRLDEGLKEANEGLKAGGSTSAGAQYIAGRALVLLGRHKEGVKMLESAVEAKRKEDRELTESRKMALPSRLRLMLSMTPSMEEIDSWLARAQFPEEDRER